MKRLARLAIPAAIAAFGVGAHAATNVALGSSVTADGDVYGAALSTVTDGVFLTEGTPWTDGSVYWFREAPNLTIDLGSSQRISGFIVQADDNDAYRLDFWNGASWATAWDVPNYDAYGWGMTTRPAADQTTVYYLPTEIETTKLRFQAVSGDGYYSVSEIQAIGAPVPEPETYAMMLAGLGVLGAVARRRRT